MARRRWNKDSIQEVLDGGNPFIQVGYTPKNVKRKPGDIWTDVKGITWEQRNGYKVRVNKQVDCIREMIKQQCSVCKKDIRMLGTNYDDKVFLKTGKCYDCLIDEHTKLKIRGEFDTHEKKVVWSNQLGYLKEVKKHLEEYLIDLPQDNKMQWVSSDGTITTWEGAQTELFIDSAKKDLEQVNKGITDLEEALSALNKENNAK